MVAILARDAQPIETRRDLPGDPSDREARYIEAAVDGVLVGCIYMPNGNPQPGPKFDYKLAWFARFLAYAAELQSAGVPAVLAGDYNVVPTDADIYDMRSWRDNALVQPEPRALFALLSERGWTDALRSLHPALPMYTFTRPLELLAQTLGARCRHAARPSHARQRNRRTPNGCRRRPRRARRAERQRSRSGLDYFTVGKMYSAPAAALGQRVVVVFNRV